MLINVLVSPIKYIIKDEAPLSPELRNRFDHAYFKESIQIIDSLIVGDEENIGKLGLKK